MDFDGEDRDAIIAVFLSKGFVEAKIVKKFRLFKGDNLPSIYLMTNGTSYSSVRNSIAISPKTPIDRLNFRTVDNGKLFRHSGMSEFPTEGSTQNESYRVIFESNKDLSKILDELIALHKKGNAVASASSREELLRTRRTPISADISCRIKKEEVPSSNRRNQYTYYEASNSSLFEAILRVFASKGYVEKKSLKKFRLFTGDDLPPVYLMTDASSKSTVRNTIAISPETPVQRLSFETSGNGRIFRHSNMTEFRYALDEKGNKTQQNESYRIDFANVRELSNVLDELIILYRHC